ncbi:MAG: family 16 glycoside hydrolase [Verrucomicrobiaceae bacterium]
MHKLILPLLLGLAPLTQAKTVLFNGNPDGWKMAGPGSFGIADGVATAKGGMGLWWHETELHNFSLHLQFKLDDPKQNSGVFLRFPDPGNDPWVAVKEGYEIQIAGDQVANNQTGSVYEIQAPIANPVKIGEWNDYHIIAANEKIAILLNGKLINIFITQPGRGDVKGFVGIQNHDDGSPVQFRNISVENRGKGGTLLEVLALAGVPRSELVQYWAKADPITTPMMPTRKGGETKGKPDWYRIADHGPAFFQSFSDWFKGEYRPESAIKGLALSYSAIPTRQALFNLETLSLVSATNEGTALHNTPWGGGHGQVNKLLNEKNSLFTAASGPVWADANGSFEDTRPIPGHGNMPNTKFLGYLRNGNGIILHYAINGTEIRDYLADNRNGLTRLMEIDAHDKPLVCRLLDTSAEKDFALKLLGTGAKVTVDNGTHFLHLAPSSEKRTVSLLYSRNGQGDVTQPVPFAPYLKAGPGISPETFTVEAQIDSSDNPWLVDTIPLPPALNDSPYLGKVRMSDFDFFSDGDRALLSTWDGDIWLVSGLKEFNTLTWKRWATGFFEPLGLRIVNDVPHIAGRDAIWQARDLNNDGEADEFKIFNNDVLITNNFHEFQFGLETDKDGNFYFAKASPVLPGGRGFDKILPHNGAFMKVSADGSTLEILATGLRAPGGIGVGPNGEITTGENEGTWQPCCKINYFEPTGSEKAFFGVENARHGNETPYTEPLCYLPMNVDNSGGGQLWVTKEAKIGIPAGELLHLSYGQSSIYHVLREKIGDGRYQGGVAKLPLKLGSSAQRAAFHPDGSMYVCGFRGWQTNAANEAAFQRIRHNADAPNPLPTALDVTDKGIKITFDQELDEELANDPTSFTVQRWKYVRSSQYGSGHFSVDHPDAAAEKTAAEKESKNHRVQDKVKVLSAKLGRDGKSIHIELEGHKPTEQMRIDYDLESTDGDELIGTIHNTIHTIK